MYQVLLADIVGVEMYDEEGEADVETSESGCEGGEGGVVDDFVGKGWIGGFWCAAREDRDFMFAGCDGCAKNFGCDVWTGQYWQVGNACCEY